VTHSTTYMHSGFCQINTSETATVTKHELCYSETVVHTQDWLHYLSSDLAVPTGTNDSSGQLVTIIVAQTLKESRGCFDERLFFNLHPRHNPPLKSNAH